MQYYIAFKSFFYPEANLLLGNTSNALSGPKIPSPKIFWGNDVAQGVFGGITYGKGRTIAGVRNVGRKVVAEPWSSTTKKLVALIVDLIISIGLIVGADHLQDVDWMPKFILEVAHTIGGFGIFGFVCGFGWFCLSKYSLRLIKHYADGKGDPQRDAAAAGGVA